jgi:hypothetical protein
MAEYADYLIAFPLGKSAGTRNMIQQARQLGLDLDYGTKHSLSLKEMEQ